MKVMHTRQPLDPISICKIAQTNTAAFIRIAILKPLHRQCLYLFLYKLLVVLVFWAVWFLGVLQLGGIRELFIEKWIFRGLGGLEERVVERVQGILVVRGVWGFYLDVGVALVLDVGCPVSAHDVYVETH
jgi:hypothetical protein